MSEWDRKRGNNEAVFALLPLSQLDSSSGGSDGDSPSSSLSIPCAPRGGRLAYFPPETTDAAVGWSCKQSPTPNRGTHTQPRPTSHRPTRPGLPIRGLPDARFSPQPVAPLVVTVRRVNTRPTTCLCFQKLNPGVVALPTAAVVCVPRSSPSPREVGRGRERRWRHFKHQTCEPRVASCSSQEIILKFAHQIKPSPDSCVAIPRVLCSCCTSCLNTRGVSSLHLDPASQHPSWPEL